MKNKISSRDHEILSSYLDGQLTAKERRKLEARLERDPQLQDVFEDLRQTRLLLRNLPKMRAPRNFTLSPQEVGQRLALPNLFPVFSFASAVASILFLIVLIGDVLWGTGPLTAVPQPISLAPEAQEVGEAVESEMMAPTLGVPEAPAQAEGLISATSTAEPLSGVIVEQEVELQSTDGQSRTNLKAAPMEPSTVTLGMSDEEQMESAIPAAPETPVTEFFAEAAPETTVEPTPMPAPTSTPKLSPTATVEPYPVSYPVSELPTAGAAGGFPFIRIVEVLLAVIALASGGIALYLRYWVRS